MPKDPIILLSYINQQLRDYYPDLQALCSSLNVSAESIMHKLAGINYVYDKDRNQFI